MKTRTLLVRLLKSGITPESSFGPSFLPGMPRQLAEQQWALGDGVRFFVGQIFEKEPAWLEFLRTAQVAIPEGLLASGAGAVLFVPVRRRVLAVCFGHAHLALDDDAFERQFGLRVVLNSVPKTSLRTLDVATPDAGAFQKRLQASVDSDFQVFGVDTHRDLARVAGGTPRMAAFASFVAGKDSLSITCQVDIGTLSNKCREILRCYGERSYRNEYAWVDNMRPVADKPMLRQLDEHLFAEITKLREGETSELMLAPPEVVDYTDGTSIHYNGFGSHGREFASLSIRDYVDELNRAAFDGTVDDLRQRHRIATKAHGSDQFTVKWRVYDCLVCELDVAGGNTFVLFDGRWYEVDRDFKRRVDDTFDRIPRRRLVGPTHCLNEEDLIAHLEATRPDMLKLDRTRINPQGETQANLEPCDFFLQDLTFLHLKDGHSSSPISHLLFQGVVSAEGFVSDPSFRTQLRQLVAERRRAFCVNLPRRGGAVDRSRVTVLYGVMRKPYSDGSLGLPFFSRLSFGSTADRLARIGVNMAIELIEKPARDDP